MTPSTAGVPAMVHTLPSTAATYTSTLGLCPKSQCLKLQHQYVNSEKVVSNLPPPPCRSASTAATESSQQNIATISGLGSGRSVDISTRKCTMPRTQVLSTTKSHGFVHSSMPATALMRVCTSWRVLRHHLAMINNINNNNKQVPPLSSNCLNSNWPPSLTRELTNQL